MFFIRFLEALGKSSKLFIVHIFEVWHTWLGALLAMWWPGYWRAPVRRVLRNQILFAGVQEIFFMAIVAGLVGLLIGNVLLSYSVLGRPDLPGAGTVQVIALQIAPALINLVVISRSGGAIVTFLGQMRVNGELRVLQGQGIDLFSYILLPRVLGNMIASVCLTLVFLLALFGSIYAFQAVDLNPYLSFVVYLRHIVDQLSLAQLGVLLAKVALPVSLATTIFCLEGIRIPAVATEVPRAVARSMATAITAMFVILYVLSVTLE